MMETLIKVKNLALFLRSNYDLDKIISVSSLHVEVLQSLHFLYKIDQNRTTANLKHPFIFCNKYLKLENILIYKEEMLELNYGK